MLKGIVESISKKSVVVTTNNQAVTLTGAAVEGIVSDLKLGDNVEFDKISTPKVIGKAKAETKSQAAPRTSSSSPNAKPQTKLDF